MPPNTHIATTFAKRALSICFSVEIAGVIFCASHSN